MNALQLMNPAHLFMEIGQDELKAVNGPASIEIRVSRLADGRLTDECKANLTSQLRRFIDHKTWQPRARVFCAVAARGVSLRRLNLPQAPKEELQRLLPLQIEAEFPLPPDQLAWGFQHLPHADPSRASHPGQDLLVAAVRKEALEEYSGILADCGATPIFTLAALARSYVCPQPPGGYAVLCLERNYSELISIDGGVPVTVRVLSWGLENLCAAAPVDGNGRETSLASQFSPTATATFGGSGQPVQDRLKPGALASLAKLMNGQSLGRRLYVLGVSDLDADLKLANRLSSELAGLECHDVEVPSGTKSVAILGLQRVFERGQSAPPLVLQVKQTNGKVQITQQAPVKWAARALALCLAALLLPCAEALILKPHLAHKLAAIKTDQGRLSFMDRELDFLQYLKENEPPYLDALLVLSKAAPPGTRFDSVSMNRRGDVSIRGSLHDGQQVAGLRSKLIDSGFFASVAIEEQAPTPDRQKVNIRMSAQWKPAASRTAPPAEPASSSSDSKNPRSPGPGGPSPDRVLSPIPGPVLQNPPRN